MKKSVAVIGSGPSGIYAAETLLKRDEEVEVVIFEKLDFPYGLVRYGVAPDHQKIKTVTNLYDRILENDRLWFFGNQEVPKDISLETLKAHFDAVIFAVGCQTGRYLNIPGEKESPLCLSACDLVYWYNGHPDYCEYKLDLEGEVIDIIGQGNVAIDVARILCKTERELRQTDMPEYAVRYLSQTPIREVNIVGRRGAETMACTAKELKELGELEEACVYVKEEDLIEAQKKLNKWEEGQEKKSAEKNLAELEVLYEKSHSKSEKSQKIHFIYETRPQFMKDQGNEVHVNVLQGREQKEETRIVNRVIKSIGYRGVALEGISFDQKKGVFLNQEGRIINEKGNQQEKLYVTGWIKRGPSGVIGTNKKDSQDTVEKVLEDLNESKKEPLKDFRELDLGKVTKEKWFEIDKKEREEGFAKGVPRIKKMKID